MTPERKNEIWAMLPEDFKEEIMYLWELDSLPVHPDYDMDSVAEGGAYVLAELFDKQNLTTQAKGKTEPLFNINDTVQVSNGFESEEIVKITSMEWRGQWWYTVRNDYYSNLCPEHDLKRYITNNKSEEKPKEPLCSVDSKNYNNGNHIVGRENNIDYAQYRLSLAKEIAIALINNTNKSTRYGDILAHDAVKITNEILKQLKETEE